jgi:glutathione synthase/RimK-type ligase-like ATP-grasp enzyme
MILRSFAELDQRFEALGSGDVVVGHLPGKYLRGALAVDLLERGVRCVPSVFCQLLSRSKVAQAVVLRRWMAPHTLTVSRRVELLDAVNYCSRHRIEAVVTKQEGMHCGHGIRRWENAEVLYNSVAFTDSTFPFVFQPYMAGISDVRVIVVGDYVEAYFRSNLATGGTSRPLAMDAAAEGLCREVMERGRFPYAHIDLQLTAEGVCYLSEITLDGGVSAARINREELNRRKQAQLEKLATDQREPI